MNDYKGKRKNISGKAIATIILVFIVTIALFFSAFYSSKSSISEVGALYEKVPLADSGPGGGSGGPGGSSSGGELDADSYNEEAYVYWDRMNDDEDASYNETEDGHIVAVRLNGIDVAWGDSDENAYASGSNPQDWYDEAIANGETPLQLADYYEGVTSGEENMEDGVLEIVTVNSYYVSRVVIACTGSAQQNNDHTVYDCGTWEEEAEYSADFDLGESYDNYKVTRISDLNSVNFAHRSSSNNYFILIELSPVPTPLYVEYDYGDIVDLLGGASYSGTAFTTSSWTVVNESNNYTDGGILTDGTQQVYDYTVSDENEIYYLEWTHYANTISSEAISEAAKAGYRFVGWEATYYIDAELEESGGSYNNYDITFSNEYNTGGSVYYEAGEEVTLTTHVRLVAIWEEITTKEFKIVKYDDAGESVLGVSFTIADTNGNEAIYTTDEDGVICAYLEYGYYMIYETETPYGYNQSDTVYYIRVDDDGIFLISEEDFEEALR